MMMDFICRNYGYQLCNSRKNQICVKGVMVLRAASGQTETVFEVVDVTLNSSSDFISIVPFFRSAKCTGIDEELAELNPIRYRSYYYDAETSLYYVESRYYDSEAGRFISADAVGNVISDYTNLNLYVYYGNDQVNYYDPTGLGFGNELVSAASIANNLNVN